MIDDVELIERALFRKKFLDNQDRVTGLFWPSVITIDV